MYSSQSINECRILPSTGQLCRFPHKRDLLISTVSARPHVSTFVNKPTMSAVWRFYTLEDECRPAAKCKVRKLTVSRGYSVSFFFFAETGNTTTCRLLRNSYSSPEGKYPLPGAGK